MRKRPFASGLNGFVCSKFVALQKPVAMSRVAVLCCWTVVAAFSALSCFMSEVEKEMNFSGD